MLVLSKIYKKEPNLREQKNKMTWMGKLVRKNLIFVSARSGQSEAKADEFLTAQYDI